MHELHTASSRLKCGISDFSECNYFCFFIILYIPLMFKACSLSTKENRYKKTIYIVQGTSATDSSMSSKLQS